MKSSNVFWWFLVGAILLYIVVVLAVSYGLVGGLVITGLLCVSYVVSLWLSGDIRFHKWGWSYEYD